VKEKHLTSLPFPTTTYHNHRHKQQTSLLFFEWKSREIHEKRCYRMQYFGWDFFPSEASSKGRNQYRLVYIVCKGAVKERDSGGG